MTLAENLADLIELRMTCGVCPEQYDAFLGGEQVGYLRLRHGLFRVDYPTCGGQTVLVASPLGDGYFDDQERERYLREAKVALAAAHIHRLTPSPNPESYLHHG